MQPVLCPVVEGRVLLGNIKKLRVSAVSLSLYHHGWSAPRMYELHMRASGHE